MTRLLRALLLQREIRESRLSDSRRVFRVVTFLGECIDNALINTIALLPFVEVPFNVANDSRLPSGFVHIIESGQ